mgnify:CR=1 FL=1
MRETPTTALIDAGGGLGYVPSLLATKMCIDKAKDSTKILDRSFGPHKEGKPRIGVA